MENSNETLENAGSLPAELLNSEVGATAGNDTMSPDDMPMIVWLRGDEDYVEDFSIDADTAMKTLGIKRSRLTQISGKELRVGRIRIGRYVRPVYRPVDIQAYVEWTRPTATHAKSSNIIEEAAGELLKQAQKVSGSYEAILEVHTADITDHINESFKDLYQTVNELLEQKQEKLFDHFNGVRSLFADLGGIVNDQEKNLNATLSGINDQLTATLSEVSDQLNTFRDKQDQLKSEISALSKFCQDVALETKQNNAKLNDFVKRQEEATANLAKVIKVNLELQKETQNGLKIISAQIKELPAPQECKAPKMRSALPPPRFK